MIEIRKLRSLEELKKTIEIQRSAWGVSDLDIEPPYLMGRIQKYGGLVQGLFLDDECVGFTYGTIGRWQGEIFFFSYMAAVMKEYQGRGFGFLLKKAQREEALKMGYDIIRWNFDPLQSLNAYFNIHRLGVVCMEYERNIYGDDGSGLDKGLPTDRLVATWNLKSDRVIKKIKAKEPRIEEDIPERKLANFGEKITYIEIPRNIRSLKKTNLTQAYQWRMRTRELFETAFKKGFIAEEMVFSKDQQRIFYKLIKKDN
ncbi:MAG: GNAT family N-acetyltransferase [Promethearchaeota archaeon]